MAAPLPIRILGIDPGTAVTGWGIVERRGSRFTSSAHGAFRPAKNLSREARLSMLTERLAELIQETEPRAVALEQAFLGKNIQSALRLGEARGALLAACGRQGVPVREFPTASVKKAVVGNGRADKTQVQFMLRRLLAMSELPTPLDASDALALAFTLAVSWKAPK